MAEQAGRLNDVASCPMCGARLTATHMLTKSYELDGMGRWKRRIADFAEDIVVACAGCGVERGGSVEVEGDEFVFVAAGVTDRISEAIQAKEE